MTACAEFIYLESKDSTFAVVQEMTLIDMLPGSPFNPLKRILRELLSHLKDFHY